MKDDDATPSGCFVIPELYFHMIMKVEHNTLLQYSQSFDFYQAMTLTKKSKWLSWYDLQGLDPWFPQGRLLIMYAQVLSL